MINELEIDARKCYHLLVLSGIYFYVNKRGFFDMETLLSLSIALFVGLMMTRVLKTLKLPSVTAYLIAGVVVGPYCLGALNIPGIGFNSHENVAEFGLISEVALGFIAFAIGSEERGPVATTQVPSGM